MTEEEKLLKIRKYTGLTWKAMAEQFGLKSPQTFIDIRNGKHRISAKMANRIVAIYPDIRLEWILTGEGEMTNNATTQSGLPLYESTDELMGEASASIDFGSCFPRADVALRNNSDSMAEYPVGCVMALRKVGDTSLLLPANDYLVVTDEFAVVKRVQKGSSPRTISLYSTNNATYPDGRLMYEPFEIPIESLKEVYSVVGYIQNMENN